MKGDFAISEGFDSMYSLLATIFEVIDHLNAMTGMDEFYDCMRADIAGAARNKNMHGVIIAKLACTRRLNSL